MNLIAATRAEGGLVILGWGHRTKFYDVLEVEGKTIQFVTSSQIFKLVRGHRTKFYDV